VIRESLELGELQSEHFFFSLKYGAQLLQAAKPFTKSPALGVNFPQRQHFLSLIIQELHIGAASLRCALVKFPHLEQRFLTKIFG